jgi:putative tricarboxylic transport membrane protein
MNNKISDCLLSVLCISFGMYIVIEAKDLNFYESIFPLLVGFGIIITALVVLSFALIRKESKRIEKKNYALVLMMIVMLVIYAILIKYAGYILSTILLCAIILYVLGYKKIKTITIVSLSVTIVTYVLFKIVLNVPLPTLFS